MRVAGGYAMITGRHGNAEVSERTGKVLFKQHLQIESVGEVYRLLKVKHRRMFNTIAAQYLPATAHLRIQGGSCVVRLACLRLTRSLLGACCGSRVTDAIFLFVIGRISTGELHRLAVGCRLKLAQEEPADRTFIVGQAGTFIGQTGMTGYFDAERSHLFQRCLEAEIIDIAL